MAFLIARKMKNAVDHSHSNPANCRGLNALLTELAVRLCEREAFFPLDSSPSIQSDNPPAILSTSQTSKMFYDTCTSHHGPHVFQHLVLVYTQAYIFHISTGAHGTVRPTAALPLLGNRGFCETTTLLAKEELAMVTLTAITYIMWPSQTCWWHDIHWNSQMEGQNAVSAFPWQKQSDQLRTGRDALLWQWNMGNSISPFLRATVCQGAKTAAREGPRMAVWRQNRRLADTCACLCDQAIQK